MVKDIAECPDDFFSPERLRQRRQEFYDGLHQRLHAAAVTQDQIPSFAHFDRWLSQASSADIHLVFRKFFCGGATSTPPFLPQRRIKVAKCPTTTPLTSVTVTCLPPIVVDEEETSDLVVSDSSSPTALAETPLVSCDTTPSPLIHQPLHVSVYKHLVPSNHSTMPADSTRCPHSSPPFLTSRSLLLCLSLPIMHPSVPLLLPPLEIPPEPPP